jgi:rubrerythrin
MAVGVEAHEDAAERLVAGARVKGEYRCTDCGYGVTIYRELPTCPMCGGELWEHLDWSPFKGSARRSS